MAHKINGKEIKAPDANQMTKDARAYGLAHGYKGELGGWIYHPKYGYVAHGWVAFYRYIGRSNIESWKRSLAK